MKSAQRSLLPLLFTVAAASVASAQTTPAKSPAAKPKPAESISGAAPGRPVRVTSVEGITEYVLGNGLHVLLFPDQTKPTITVNITYLVGSRHENYGETGMAHLLEHLMFKGSPKHPNIPQELTAHGARPNGTTWFDRTNYFETFQATEENLQWALELEADRMVNSFIAKKDLDSEMTVVRNEFELGENFPTNVLEERVLSTAFLWHSYGRSTIGARADIENVPIERLQAFYRTYYQPDNAYLLVAGKFDEAKTLDKIHKIFSAIPSPTRTIQKTYTAEPTQDGERSVTLRRVGDVQALAVAYHTPAGSHTDAAAVQLLTEVLADTPSGRLHKALVETKKASSVSGFFPSLREPGFLLFRAEVRQESSLEEAQKTMLQTIDAILTSPPVKEEVDRSRAKLLKNIELTLNSSDRVGLQMSEWIGAGDWRLFFLNRDRIRKIAVEDVQRVAATYLKPSNRTVGMFIPTAKPDRAEIPPLPDVAAMLKDYKGKAAAAAGEAFDPSPSNIESHTTRTELPNGLRVALLPKKTRGGSVVAAILIHFGDEKSLMNRSTAARLAGDMLMRGTAKHTRQQIKDEFDLLKARVFVSGTATQTNVSVETVRENLPAVMKLVGEILREPSFPASEFDPLKQEMLASIEQQRSEPTQMGATAFTRHLSPYPKGDVRYVATPEEEVTNVKATTLDDVKKFYTDFYGGSRAELAIVGDFDASEIAKLATDLFGNWKSPKPFTRVPRPYRDISAANQSLEAPDKANAFFIAGLNLNLRDDDPDYSALLLGNYMLGGGFLNSRLATRIRQKEGISYGVGSQLQASPLDKSGSFVTFAIYAPQNVAKLEAAFKEEIARALKDGFEAKEIAQAKSGFLQSRQVTRAQDAQLVRTLAQYLFLKRTLEWDAGIEKKIGALTAEQIVSALRKHIDPAKITMIKAGDFAKALPAKDIGEVLKPPMAKKVAKAETLHGEERRDDYFWLREKQNPEVKAYLDAENAYTDSIMKGTEPLQESLYKEMLGRIKETDLSVPYRKGDFFYYSRTEQGKQYPIYCRKKGSLEAPEQVTLDLNELAKGEKFLALDAYEVSGDGNLLAYTTDVTGFREYILHWKDLRTGELVPERIQKVSTVAWAADNKTLFYVTEDHAKRPYRIYRHALGTDPASDPLLSEVKDEMFRVFLRRSRSRSYVFATSASHTASEVRYLRADRPETEFQLILPREKEREYYVDHRGDLFYIHTNDEGRNFRVVAAPVADPRKENWKEIRPHREEVMVTEVDLFSNHLVLSEREDGLPRLSITDLSTSASHRIAFPEPVYTAFLDLNPEFQVKTLRYRYQSFTTPESVYDYDMGSRESKLLKRTEVLGGYDPVRYGSERVFARASDGTRIPISMVYRKGMKRNGKNPLLLGGYGSYGSPRFATFDSNRVSLLDRGLIFALAHIRGGGEMGKKWHDSGRMMSKKNTFTDFIAAAEHLIKEKYTSRDRLVIAASSAGGLLMGAVVNMRPDLFRAVISRVPFVDVINTMLDESLPLTVGEFEEWGNPKIKEQYDYIKSYSPYDNIAAKDYPAMLVKTSFNDSQVMYWEPAKYVARLRSIKTDKNPLLFKVNMAGGHGGSSGRYDRLREIAFDYAFVLTQLRLEN